MRDEPPSIWQVKCEQAEAEFVELGQALIAALHAVAELRGVAEALAYSIHVADGHRASSWQDCERSECRRVADTIRAVRGELI